ncbi:trehalose-phosphatase [Rhizobiaceae bacterium]|nr:trehalose-phosphatase [Rhizobiaceae bacterium]
MHEPPPIIQDAALFLDFDGTLVAFAETPDAVSVPPRLNWLIGRLSARLDGALAFVTGRAIENLDRLLGAADHIAVGVHGAEWRLSAGKIETVQGTPFHAETEAVADFAAKHEPLVLERKSGGVTLHFRRAPQMAAETRSVMESAFGARQDFELLAGNMMWEARRKGVHKGAGIERLMQNAPFAGRTPVFIGDDVTDEDGFRAVEAAGGLGIKVGDGDTSASGRLPDIDAVYAYLERMAAPGSPAGDPL